jgi:acyl-CoA thioester hydrolase/1,4-dihydroxy-2-naphthoyl-CoA hydrolase
LIHSIEKQEDYWNNDKYVVPIIHTESSYIKPIKYDAEIMINVRVSELRNSSFKLSYNMENESGELLCSVKTVHVFVNKHSWEKMEIPEPIRLGLEGMI